jgi:ribosomal protein S14
VCYQDMSTRPRLIRSILKTLMVAHQRNRNKFPATKRNKKKYKELFLCGGSHTKFISTFRLCRVTVRDAASLGEKRLHAAWNIVSQSVAACVARRGVALRSMSWRIVSLFHFFIFLFFFHVVVLITEMCILQSVCAQTWVPAAAVPPVQ